MNKLSRKELAEVFYGLLKSTNDQQRIATDIAEYLMSERRTSELDALLREVERLRMERDGIVEAMSISARPLSEDVKEMIRGRFGAKTRLLVREDKELVGGAYVQTLDKRLDLSVRGRLNELKHHNMVKG